MKETLFKNLTKLISEISLLKDSDKANGKKVLTSVDDIVSQFNKGKYEDGPTELDLDENDLVRLKTMVDKIWEYAADKNVEVWPKPDIINKIG